MSLLIDTFNKKIDHFSYRTDYPQLRKKADEALCVSSGYGLQPIIAMDIIERIAAMPLDYIRDWLDGKNELEWRKEDEKMLQAIKGGYVDLLELYPNHEIHHIAKPALSFYAQLGYEVLKTDRDTVYVGKLIAKNT